MVLLTKSYFNSVDPERPLRNVTFYQVLQEAKERGFVGEILNLETGTSVLTTEIFMKADQYAKGLLAIGYTPGEDTLAVIGGSSLEPMVLYVAALSIGVGYAKPYIYAPEETCIVDMVTVLEAKAVVIGESGNGNNFSALANLFDDGAQPKSTLMPLVQHVFYDNSHRDRSPQQKYIHSLSKLLELGETISDEQLQAAKKSVTPDFVLGYVFSSGSTGKPKCIAHGNRGLANDLSVISTNNNGPLLTINLCMDEMVSIGMISLTLAGKFTKLVLSQDIRPENIEEATRVCAEILVSERIETVQMGGHLTQLLAKHVRELELQVPDLKYVSYGGQVVSRSFKENIKSVFGDVHFTIYGISELAPVCHTTFGDSLHCEESRLNAQLYAKPNIEVRIVDENGLIVDIGQVGKIEVRCYSAFKEYKQMKEKTKEVFTEDGFYKTGDVGVMSSDGSIQLNGRAVDGMKFKVQNKMVYPGPIEAVLSQYPGIKNAAVLTAGTNDVHGDEVTYCISLCEGENRLDEANLMEHLQKSGVDRYGKPARILYFDTFPTTPNNRKISRPELRQEIVKRIEADSNAGMTKWYTDLCQQV